MGVEPIESCVTGRPRHRLCRTAYGCVAALIQLAWVTLFVDHPPRENRTYDAMGSRKVRFQPLTVIIAVRPAAFAVALAMVVLSCICDTYPTEYIFGCQIFFVVRKWELMKTTITSFRERERERE